MASDYRYDCFVEAVIDGDTVLCIIDVGFNMYRKERIRLFGVDAPETRSKNLEEKAKGLETKSYVTDRIEKKHVEIETTKQEKFGRYLGKIFINEICLNDELIEKSLAKPYFGGKREEH